MRHMDRSLRTDTAVAFITGTDQKKNRYPLTEICQKPVLKSKKKKRTIKQLQLISNVTGGGYLQRHCCVFMCDATLRGKFTVLTSDSRVKMTGINAHRDDCRDEGNVKKNQGVSGY